MLLKISLSLSLTLLVNPSISVLSSLILLSNVASAASIAVTNAANSAVSTFEFIRLSTVDRTSMTTLPRAVMFAMLLKISFSLYLTSLVNSTNSASRAAILSSKATSAASKVSVAVWMLCSTDV